MARKGMRRKGWPPKKSSFTKAKRMRRYYTPGAVTTYYVCPVCGGAHSRSDHP